MNINTRYEVIVQVEGVKYYLDTYDYSPITVDYQISDIRQIENRNGSRSLTIEFPETQNNRFVFNSISNLNSNSIGGSQFNANFQTPVEVLIDTISVFRGTLQFIQASVDRNTNETKYECILEDDVVGFWNDLGDGFLTDDDYSYLNHNYTYNNITESWSKDWKLGYYYPLIDYGRSWSLNGVNNTATYSRGTQSISYSYISGLVNIQDFYPAVYTKTILNQLFYDSGYRYKSDFLENSDVFNNLIIPSFCDTVTLKPYINERIFRVGMSSTQSISCKLDGSGEPVKRKIEFNNESDPNGDPNGFWDTSNLKYTNVKDDIFIQRFGLSLDVFIPDVNRFYGGYGYGIESVDIIFTRNTTPARMMSIFNNTFKFKILNDPSQPSDTVKVTPNIHYNGVTGSMYNITVKTDWINGNNLTSVPIRPNEEVICTATAEIAQNCVSTDAFPAVIMETSYLFSEVNSKVFPGGPIDMNTLIPKQLKKRDFFMNIVNMFNLCIQPDKDDPKTLIIEPYNDFFDGDIIDWTNKIDTYKPEQVKMTSELQSKTTFFTYKEDKDLWNTDYKSRTQEIWGQKKFIIDNDFVKGEKKISLNFSPTPLIGLNRSDGSPSNIVIPSAINNSSLNSGVTFPQMNYRMLLRTKETSGLLPILQSTTTPDKWYFIDCLTQSAPVEFTSYPYAGHFDNPYTPTIDINFGDVLGFYYGGTILPSQNLYYSYWKKMLDEYSLPDSKLVTLDMWLNTYDISQFSFRNRIYLDIDGGAYYKVNKISQYTIGVNKPTTVELIKTRNLVIPKTTQPETPNSLGFLNTTSGFLSTSVTNTTTAPHVISIGSANNHFATNTLSVGNMNSISGLNSISVGNSNNLAANGSFVMGNSNTNYSPYSTIFGNNNFVSASASNSFLIGNNINATQSGALYINAPVIFGTSSSFIEDVTFSDLVYNLIPNNLLVKGTFYRVDTNQTTYKNNGIYLQAVSNNQLSNSGTIIFLAPTTYDTTSNWLGVWNSALTPSIGDLAIWGGLVWTNVNGLVGTATNYYTLDSEWTVVPKNNFTNSEYTEMVLDCKFDFVFDVGSSLYVSWVEQMSDKNGNVVGIGYDEGHPGVLVINPCDLTDWNYNTGPGEMYNNKCKLGIYNNYYNCVISDNDCVSIYNNYRSGGCNITYNIIKGSIYNNKSVSISNNTNNGGIYDNPTNAYINNNSNNGNIFNNSNTFLTFGMINNSNNGDISNNTSSVNDLFNNSNNGSIDSNTNNGGIFFNSNNGDINTNTNTGNISHNSNIGSIYSNSNNGFPTADISRNSNNGDIYNNSNNNIGIGLPADITDNSNNGSINSNSNYGNIRVNSNNGSIIGNLSSIGEISGNFNNGNIILNRGTVFISILSNINNGYISGTFSSNVTDTIVNK